VSDDPSPATPTRVVLLAGPSGCGKSHIARASGLPILALDDFYRDATEPGLPRAPTGDVDWEDPASWDADAALRALQTLCTDGEVDVPTYSFARSAVVGHRTLRTGGSPTVVAEGIFAAELIGPLRERGLLADALLITVNRWLTFVRRLVRDAREGRKPVLFLVRQGWTKTASEPAVVAHQRAAGARPVSKAQALARLAELSSDRVHPHA
jgi:uridine kinase